ncbi:MAG: WD40 repeat domain-containing serine/threonine protein kinase [Planctomycetota bacterium]
MNEIGGYQVRGELGRGAMGVVLRAWDPQAGREVALKVLRGRADDQTLGRFRREAEALGRIAHPNVVAVHSAGVHEGRPFLVLELVPEARSLQQVLDREGALPPAEAARLVACLARATEHVHALGLLHRDLKPDNVLLRADGQPLLGDFGLARALDGEGERLTRSNVALGTPGYWSPEQAAGELGALGPATDVYGLGATLFALLTREPPFAYPELTRTMVATVSEPPRPPSRLAPGVSPALDAIVLRCLAKDPALRFPSAAALADALEQSERAPAGRGGRRATPALAALAALALAALTAGLWTSRWRSEPSTGSASPSAGSPSAGSPSAGSPSAGSPSAGPPSAGPPSAGPPRAGLPDFAAGFRFGPRLRLSAALGSWDWRVPYRIAGLAYLPDGKHLATAGAHWAVYVHDVAARGRVLQRFQHPGGALQVAAISSGRLVSLCRNGWLYRWPSLAEIAAGGARAREYEIHKGLAWKLARDARGERIATHGQDGALCVWELPSERRLVRVEVGAERPTALCLSPDGRRVLVVTSGVVACYDVEASAWAWRKDPDPAEDVQGAVVLPDGVRVALAGRRLRLVALEDGAELGPRVGLEAPAKAVTALADGRLVTLGSGAADRLQLSLWDPGALATPLASLAPELHAGDPELCASPAGDEVAFLARERGVYRWAIGAGTVQGPDPGAGHVDDVRRLAIRADGAEIASADEGRRVLLWDVAAGRPRADVRLPREVLALAFDRGRLLVGCDGAVSEVRGTSAHELRRLERAGGVALTALGFGPELVADRRWVVWATARGDLRATRLARDVEAVTLRRRPGREVTCISVAEDRALVVDVASQGPEAARLQAFDLRRGEELWSVEEGGTGTRATLAPDARLALSSGFGRLKLWGEGGQLLWRAGTEVGYGVAILPGSARALTCSNEGRLELRSLQDGSLLEDAALGTKTDYDLPFVVAVTPDGRHAALGTSRGVVLRCDLASD